MLLARFRTALLMLGVLVLVLWLDEMMVPYFPFWFALAVLLMGQASREIVNLLDVTSARPSGNTVLGGVMALIVANWGPHVTAALLGGPDQAVMGGHDPTTAFTALAWPMWAFVSVVMVAFIAQSIQFRGPGVTMSTLAGTVLAITYVGLLGSFVLQFRWLSPQFGILPLALLVATAKGADIGAYTMGRIAGRHKLWPRLSPNKTIEGAIGGLVFGVLGASLVLLVSRGLLSKPLLTWPEAIGFGVVVGSAAQLGDLMESMIKRDCERKDSSATLPGFGGVLDVLDSLLFAGPVALGYWLFLGP